MLQYQNLIREVRDMGVWSSNRTPVPTTRLDGAMMRFDLTKGFPAVTSKRLAFKSVVGELCAFLRASRSAADFRELGCKVWDDNANNNNADGSPNPWLSNPFRLGEDDIGPVYGVQWREWPGYKVLHTTIEAHRIEHCLKNGWVEIMRGRQRGMSGEHAVLVKEFDQLGECIRQIIKAPTGRRILFHGWNPAVLDEVALPACHLLYQFLPDPTNGKLNMIMYVRSNDVGLGTPFNMAEAAALQHVIARLTGYGIGRLTYFIGDAHIYDNQNAYLDELLTKDPLPLPTLVLNDRIPSFQKLIDPHDPDPQQTDNVIGELIGWLRKIEPTDFVLENYQFHTLETPVPKMVI